MKQYLQPNKIKQQSDSHNAWPDLYFLAEAEQDGFADLQIITLSAFKQEEALNQACAIGGTLKTIRRNAKKLESTISAVEFVEVFEDHIQICLDAERVDDHLVNRALSILSKFESFIPGQRLLLNASTHANN
jgi:hypothetical protein